VNGKYHDSGLIYMATINEEFKMRFGAHKHSFNNTDANQTTLHELNMKQVYFNQRWDIIDNAKPFNPVSGINTLYTYSNQSSLGNFKPTYRKVFKPHTQDQNVIV
jgi:hypothetical protein